MKLLSPSYLISPSNEIILWETIGYWLMFKHWGNRYGLVFLLSDFCPWRNSPIHTYTFNEDISEGTIHSCSWRKAFSYLYYLNSKGFFPFTKNQLNSLFNDRIWSFHISSVKGIIKEIATSPLYLDVILIISISLNFILHHYKKSSCSTVFLK